MKKTISIVLVVLFVFSGFTVSINSEQGSFHSDGDTLYVGGLGSGNYSTIQSAIENASDGDTVFVYEGTYYLPSDDYLIISKAITLTGREKNNTIVESRGFSGIAIDSDNVLISNFTFKNIALTNTGDFITIRSNHFKITTYESHVGSGVINFDGSQNVIENNHIIFHEFSRDEGNPYNALSIRGSHFLISNNIIQGSGNGLDIEGNSHYIQGNSFIENENGVFLTRDISSSTLNQITENNFLNNEVQANFIVEFPSVILFLKTLLSSDELSAAVWNRNYWSDHNIEAPRKISGKLKLELDDFVFDIYVKWSDIDEHPLEEPI